MTRKCFDVWKLGVSRMWTRSLQNSGCVSCARVTLACPPSAAGGLCDPRRRPGRRLPGPVPPGLQPGQALRLRDRALRRRVVRVRSRHPRVRLRDPVLVPAPLEGGGPLVTRVLLPAEASWVPPEGPSGSRSYRVRSTTAARWPTASRPRAWPSGPPPSASAVGRTRSDQRACRPRSNTCVLCLQKQLTSHWS